MSKAKFKIGELVRRPDWNCETDFAGGLLGLGVVLHHTVRTNGKDYPDIYNVFWAHLGVAIDTEHFEMEKI